MTSKLVHYIVTGIVAGGGLGCILFALLKGRRYGIGAAFGLGGLLLMLYGLGFGFSITISRYAAMASAAGAYGKADERTAFVERVQKASVPIGIVEPAAMLLLAVGFAGLGKAADARHAARAGSAIASEAEPPLTGGDEPDAFVDDFDAEADV